MTSTFAPSALQNALSFSTAAASAPSGGVRMHQRLTNSSEKPESGPGVLGAGDRMRRDQMHALRDMRRHVLEHLALDRADVGDDRAGLERRRDLGRDRPARADRNADDDEVGVLRGLGVGLDHLIRDAELDHALACRFRARGRDDRAHHAVFARRARNRAADQPDADQREAVDDGSSPLLPHQLGERRDHEAVRLLGADAHAQRVRQVIGADRAHHEAARGEQRVGILRGLALGLGEVDQDEIADARRDRQAELADFFGEPCEPFLVVLRASARHAPTSAIAATPAAIDGAFTLNGPRMRLSASTTCAGP